MSFSTLDILADEDPLSRGAHFGRYCLYMIAAQALGFLFLLAGLGRLAARARQIPPVVGFTSEHRPLTGKIAPLGMTGVIGSIALVRDIVESALTRTQTGICARAGLPSHPILRAKKSAGPGVGK